MRLLFILLMGVTFAWAKIGTISAVRGEATVVRGSEVLSAKIALAVEAKDTITTKAHSKVQVILQDQTVITIGPKSKFTFDAYSFPKDPHAKMRSSHGFFKAVTGKIGKIAPERFSIKMRSATIGIRGTHFIGYSDEKCEKIGCLKGKIVVQTELKTYTVPANSMVTYSDGVWRVEVLDMGQFDADQIAHEYYRPGLDQRLIDEQTMREHQKETESIGPDQPFSNFSDD